MYLACRCMECMRLQCPGASWLFKSCGYNASHMFLQPTSEMAAQVDVHMLGVPIFGKVCRFSFVEFRIVWEILPHVSPLLPQAGKSHCIFHVIPVPARVYWASRIRVGRGASTSRTAGRASTAHVVETTACLVRGAACVIVGFGVKAGVRVCAKITA